MPSSVAASMHRPLGVLKRLGDEGALELFGEGIEDVEFAALQG